MEKCHFNFNVKEDKETVVWKTSAPYQFNARKIHKIIWLQVSELVINVTIANAFNSLLSI